jgi:hypothetical protein
MVRLRIYPANAAISVERPIDNTENLCEMRHNGNTHSSVWMVHSEGYVSSSWHSGMETAGVIHENIFAFLRDYRRKSEKMYDRAVPI